MKGKGGDERFRVIARRDVERGRPGWIIAVVSVTVGLFEYLIEEKKRREGRRERKSRE